LQDAIVADLADLFEGQTLPSSAGDRRPIRVYSQGLPIIEGLDETEDRTEEIPEPYIIVRTNEGNIPDANSAQEIADCLFLSKRTVERHISALYEKTGAKSRITMYLLYRND